MNARKPAICGLHWGPMARRLGVRPGPVPAHSQNRPVDLARISWLITVGACLIAVLVLVIQGYIGYAGVTLAVAVCAAVNLF
jgi:hypothetical protein